MSPTQRTILALLLGVVLAGCGQDEPDTASDPQSTTIPSETASETASETPSETPSETASTDDSGAGGVQSLPATGNAGVTEVTLVSATDAGGTASTLASVLDTEQARDDFAAQFERDFDPAAVAGFEAQESAGSIPYGAIVAVGCDAPESVRIDAGEAGLEVTPRLPKETVQCFAPMTFVVLFSAPAA